MVIAMPKISVITAAYNVEAYIAETVQSIVNQTFSDFELIIVDDASTDSTPTILAELAKKDARIKIITNSENLERCISRNKAIEAAQGDFLAIMDADDIALPFRFEKQLEIFAKHPELSICGSYCQCFGFISGVWKRPVDHDSILAELFFSSTFIHSSVMMKRSAIPNDELFFDTSFPRAQDYDLFCRLIFDTKAKAYNIPEVLVKYRTSPPSDFFIPWHTEILRKNLLRLGISANKQELSLLSSLILNPTSLTLKNYSLSYIISFIDELYKANQQTNLIKSQYFSHRLNSLLFQIAVHTNISKLPLFFSLSCLKESSFLSRTMWLTKLIIQKIKTQIKNTIKIFLRRKKES